MLRGRLYLPPPVEQTTAGRPETTTPAAATQAALIPEDGLEPLAVPPASPVTKAP